MLIDLHMHSHFSDGLLSPRSLVKLACNAGLECISLTDHDTCEGTEAAQDECSKRGIKFLSGIEVSSNMQGEVHILGHNVDCNALKPTIALIQRYRRRRVTHILQKLQALGYEITQADVNKQGKGSLGKVNIAKALIAKNYFSTFDSAFALLKKGGQAYVEDYEFATEKAIQSIIQAGGMATLAHPALIGWTSEQAVKNVAFLKECGLSGMETIYKKHTKKEIKFWRGLAEKFDLYESVGGDNHSTTEQGFFACPANKKISERLLIFSK